MTGPKRLGAALLLALLANPVLGQISDLGTQAPAQGTCSVSTEELRVLPNDYQRSVLGAFSSVSSVNSLTPVIPATASCRFLSFDPAFDQIIGSNGTLYQVGPNRTYN